MTVATDPLYIAARCVLLDALDALAEHRDAVIIVGAQAVYLHSNDADLDAGVAPYTTDGDLAIVPQWLNDETSSGSCAGTPAPSRSGGRWPPWRTTRWPDRPSPSV
ncbi:hypothetical protein GCM10009681_40260 [Luedemannella helvata]|uniref:Uncharacterized protein n=1 Tax=Luedemannella helvata TaxID=349315 RepID=A0ABP4X0W6_9ACTN